MQKDFFSKIFGLVLGLVLIFAVSNSVSAQGKSGNNKGKSNVNSNKNKSSDTRGNSDSRNRNNRNDDDDDRDMRNDDHRRNDNQRRNGSRDDRDNDRAESNRYRGLAKKLGMSPEEARNYYEREKDRNPDLTYGQFVAANMIARKYSSNDPRLTAESIFDRLRNGENFGQAVKSLGLKDKDYKEMKKRMKRDSKNDRDDDDDYR